MATFPSHGSGNWDDDLKAYIDAKGITQLQISQVAAEAQQAASAALAAQQAAQQATSVSGIATPDAVVAAVLDDPQYATTRGLRKVTRGKRAAALGDLFVKRLTYRDANPPTVTKGALRGPNSGASPLARSLGNVSTPGSTGNLTAPAAHNLAPGDKVQFLNRVGMNFTNGGVYTVRQVVSPTVFNVYAGNATTGNAADMGSAGTSDAITDLPINEQAWLWDTTNVQNPIFRSTESVVQQATTTFPGRAYIRANQTALTVNATPTYAGTEGTVWHTSYAQDKFDLVAYNNGSGDIQVFVDHRLVDTITPAQLTAVGSNPGSEGYKVYTFPDSTRRLITVRQTGNGLVAGLLRPLRGTAPSAPDEVAHTRFISFHGDSFTEGPYVEYASRYLSEYNVHRLGAGSTGYNKDGTRLRFVSRYQHDLIDPCPNVASSIAVIAHGLNDDRNDSTMRTATVNAATTVWDAFIAQRPLANLVIIGPYSPKGRGYQLGGLEELDRLLNLAADARGLPYISPIQEDWITGNGNTASPTGNGNADIYISSDTTHPTDLGHKMIGSRVAGHLALLFPALSSGLVPSADIDQQIMALLKTPSAAQEGVTRLVKETILPPVLAKESIADDVFASVFDRATSDSVPVYSVNSAAQIASPVIYRPAIVNTGVQKLAWDGRTNPVDANFYFSPGLYSTGNGGNNDLEMHGDVLTGGSSQAATWTQSIEFVTSATDRFEIEVYNPNGGVGLTVEVDGETALVKDSVQNDLTGMRYMSFVFPSAQVRYIRLSSPYLRFVSLRVPTGATIAKPSAITGRRVGVHIGDSWGGGSGSEVPGHGSSRVTSYAEHLLRLMGANDRVNLSIGGTGAVNGGATNAYYTRVPSALSINPNFLILQASQNDEGGNSQATIQAAFEALLAQTSSVSERYLLTTFWPDSQMPKSNAAARAAAAAYGPGVRLIDVAGVISGTSGTINAPVGVGTRNLFLGAAGVHVTAQGHRYMARQAFRKIAPYLYS